MLRSLARLLAIPSFLLLTGCGKPARFEPRDEPSSAEAASLELEETNPFVMNNADAQVYGRAAEAAPPARYEKSRKSPGKFSASLGSSRPEPQPVRPAPQPSQRPVAKRMVHYSGTATLRSTEPERILDSAIAVVKAGGGYLESRTSGFVALRVPSQDFDTLFLRLLRLAQVVDYNQQAEDITEAVSDTDLRLKVVASTLERLEDLVKKARTESQKLRLLRELKKFREEREVLESRKRDLIQRVRFASIHLMVETYAPWASAESWRQDIRDFLWIHKLSPFDDTRFQGRSTLKFASPEGMVVSRKRRPWRATSSQGSEFWGSELDVEPLGDSRFWRESIRDRLKDGFKTVDTLNAGAFHFSRFKSFGPTPYFYWVGVRSRGDEIDLAEFYFPNEDQQTKLLPGLLAAVERKSK
jgi:hypothetical protein